ncbi:MAG: hypothetical protein ACQESK_08015 [Bacteroidota bacterium]
MKNGFYIEKIVVDFIIPILVIILSSVIILLVYNRFNIGIININRKIVGKKINTLLTNVVFDEYSDTELENRLSNFKYIVPLHQYWCKDLIIKIIIDTKANLKGFDDSKLTQVYEKLELHKYTYKFMNSPFWFAKTKAIYQFQMLDYKKSTQDIKQYIQHKNKILRANALIAYLMLTKEDLSFLIDYKYELPAIEELKIVEICKARKLKRPLKLKEFLLSNNNFLIRLGLRLSSYYNALDLQDEIIFTLKNTDKKVRKLAYFAIEKLYLYQSESLLIEQYCNETRGNKRRIVFALGEIGSQESLSFFEKVLERQKDKTEAFFIIKAMLNIQDDFFEGKNISKDIELSIKHISEPLLK